MLRGQHITYAGALTQARMQTPWTLRMRATVGFASSADWRETSTTSRRTKIQHTQKGSAGGPRYHAAFRHASAPPEHKCPALAHNRSAIRALDTVSVEMGELVAELSSARGLRSPTADTIWVREPTGSRWLTIPRHSAKRGGYYQDPRSHIHVCFTPSCSQDFPAVIYDLRVLHRDGPEIEYIRRGNRAAVRDANNTIIDQTQFTSVLKPEMRFDIGVIGDGGNSVDGCSNVECANLFRIVFQPPPKYPT
ncbi:hypothetical protein PC9H_011861 [Pleurotus ostreatus]|uniref:Uncharacterized protein n=1 Tax=Pleurotus ostreatus TaxID=5322 RepID=A0A8H6ZLU6_PLEOS|nr:uncharacterized protein PC9H_011861 [Pleurotus ostreatus]KAF7421338.1 hypothetical protein PC9H_011861 [Pleurotus ostreatus]